MKREPHARGGWAAGRGWESCESPGCNRPWCSPCAFRWGSQSGPTSPTEGDLVERI